ncbi:nucleoside deaminase [Algoriphagus namhaensis]
MKTKDEKFMQKATSWAMKAMRSGAGGPFGAVVEKDGVIVGESGNQVHKNHDPTAHAEIEAIRMACQTLKSKSLEGCTLYSSCEPCPMCTAAIYFAKITTVYYACDREDSAHAGFDNRWIYKELAMNREERSLEMKSIGRDAGLKVFEAWLAEK